VGIVVRNYIPVIQAGRLRTDHLKIGYISTLMTQPVILNRLERYLVRPVGAGMMKEIFTIRQTQILSPCGLQKVIQEIQTPLRNSHVLTRKTSGYHQKSVEVIDAH
jgi:hypothetical protein